MAMIRIALFAFLALCSVAQAQRVSSITSAPDPYALPERPGVATFCNASGMTARSPVINPAIRNVVLIVAGQSLRANTLPTLFIPTNAAAVDNLNICDGALYPISTYLLSSSLGQPDYTQFPGNISARIADRLIANNKADRVILAPIAVGASTMAMWGDGGVLAGRLCLTMRRLAALGITPATPGVTFAVEWGIGESDSQLGTSAPAFTASFNNTMAQLASCGFAGRVFLSRETWAAGVTNATIQGAQTALVNNTTVWASGNLDTLDNSFRPDGTHLNDLGAATATTLIVGAMAASGAPF